MRGFAPGACSIIILHDLYTLRSIVWEITPYYGIIINEEVFSGLFNLPWDLASKYLTGLTSGSILQGGNSAPENELCL